MYQKRDTGTRITDSLRAATVLLSVAACGVSPSAPNAQIETSADTPDALNKGQFIIRVMPTGEVAPIDPILAPNGVAPHTHVFFGAKNVTSTSNYSTLVAANQTTAKDPDDTAAYWVPQLFYRGQPWNPGCTGTPPNLTCGGDPATTYSVRAYYTTEHAQETVQFPRVAMISGYPHAKGDPHQNHSDSLIRVHYSCGAARKNGDAMTPSSSWPYSCTNFSAPEFDGVVMVVDFPECWNGATSGILNGEPVVQYIDPAIESGVANDLAYEQPDTTCPTGFPHRIPHVSLRVHTLIENPSSDDSTIWPSDCTGSSFPCQTQDEPADGVEGLSLSSDAGTPGGWYTFHGDYIQSWQMGAVDDPFSIHPPPNQDDPENPGTLNDLTEDCLRTGTTCSFQPDRSGVYQDN